MSTRVVDLSPPLAESAAAEQAALAELPEGTAVLWRIPAGTHALSGDVSWGAPGIDLTVAGTPGASLAIDGAGLGIVGRDVCLERVELRVQAGSLVRLAAAGALRARDLRGTGGAMRARGQSVLVEDIQWDDADGAGASEAVGLDVEGDTVEATGVRVAMRGTGSGPRVGLLVTGRKEVVAGDLEVSNVHAPSAVGLEIAGGEIALAGVNVNKITQIGVAAAGFPAVTAVAAIGMTIEADGGIDASRLASRDVQGATAIGVRLVGGGVGGLTAVDVRAEDVKGVEAALGVLVAARGGVRTRGVTARGVKAARALGLLVRAGGVAAKTVDAARAAGELVHADMGFDVSVVHVEDVLGTGGSAAGARLCLVDPGARGVARDVHVEAVGTSSSVGTPPNDATPPDGEPPATWVAWATSALSSAPGTRPRRGAVDVPAWPADADVAGLCVLAPATPLDVMEAAARAVHVTDGAVRRIGGLALRVLGRLRPVVVRRMELVASARAAYVQGEEALLAEATLHAHRTGLRLGAGLTSIANTLISGIAVGPSVELGPDAMLAGAALVLTAPTNAAELPALLPLGPLPYRVPGSATAPEEVLAGAVPVAEGWDLRLAEEAAILRLPPARVPGDDEVASFLGAHAPEVAAPCDARDPEPPPLPVAPVRPPPPAPVASFLVRDAEGFLDLMLDRARVTMPTWTDRGPADQTTMLFELLADRLDLLAQKQERAVAEGFLHTAELRRSVEDHARALDCVADPGLSATTMVRFFIDLAKVPPLRQPAFANGVEIPAGTLVGNREPSQAGLLFATEARLVWLERLDELALAEDAPAGATEAALAVQLDAREAEALRGRWLVFHEDHATGHVVRVTEVSAAPDRVRVSWDPRRPLPRALRAKASPAGRAAVALGNVIPAHHGVPLATLGDEDAAADTLLGRYRSLLSVEHDGRVPEVPLPFSPVSVQAAGYPFPGETRTGAARVEVSVAGVRWSLSDDLSLAGMNDRVCVLRAGTDGGQVLRFGDGRNGARMPARKVRLDLSMSVGLGAVGNVGANRLSALVAWGKTSEGLPTLPELLADEPGPARDDLVRAVLRVSNPLAAIGGRDPELLGDLRDRAPRTVSDALSAVTLADYERLSCALPEVAAARASLVDWPVSPCVRVTVLLRDADTLSRAELRRRWALVRRRLEDARLLGFDVETLPPRWVPLDLDVAVDAAPDAEAGAVRDGVWGALAGQGGLFDPDTAGLGGAVHLSAVYRALLDVPGVVAARVLRFRRLERDARDGLAEGVIPVASDEVPVLRHPYAGTGAGVLTVTVCGGLR